MCWRDNTDRKGRGLTPDGQEVKSTVWFSADQRGKDNGGGKQGERQTESELEELTALKYVYENPHRKTF